MPVPKYIAEKALDLRAKGWSVKAIAVACGVCPATASKILKGQVAFSIEDHHREVKSYRCKGCGNIVWLEPCLICEMRG